MKGIPTGIQQGVGALLLFLIIVGALLYFVFGASMTDTLNAIGGLATALTLVGAAIGFYIQRAADRRSEEQLREEKRASMRHEERARALEVVRNASESLGRLDLAWVYLANSLTAEQASACYDSLRFELSAEQKPDFDDIVLPETACEPNTLTLRLKHVMRIQGVALGYLNTLESALIARDRGFADEVEMKRQFRDFYLADARRMILYRFIDAAGRDRSYPQLCKFEEDLRNEIPPSDRGTKGE